MKIVNERNVEARLLEKGDARKTYGKYLITDKEGAKKFHMRIFIVEPGGQTSYDQHIYEHEVYVLRGKGKIVVVKDGDRIEVEIKPGDAILIESNEIHQIFNTGNEPLEFICIKGVEEIY
jgi:mannose-6-phosphate isomerase-like protein (cupin superfamily)